MKKTWSKLGGALVAGATGLALIAIAVEKSMRIQADAENRGVEAEPPGGTFILIVIGVMLLTFAAFGALTVLSRLYRTRPEARRIPTWVLLIAFILVGGIGLAALTAHTERVYSLDPVPLEVDPGFVAYQVACGTIAMAALVVAGARWSPGRKSLGREY